MTTALVHKLQGNRDFRKILEFTVKELGENFAADVSQIVLSNPLDKNLTSICEYRPNPDVVESELSVCTFGLPLQGSGLGMLRIARREPMSEEEINYVRIAMAELSDIVRHAQINDIVQRETFLDTFLAEIKNIVNIMPGIGDALFMVVNILGKALNASRALFICVDDSKASWKCYEFWHIDRVQSSRDFGWPTTDSTVVARALLSNSPLILYEGNQNSHMTPVQEELSLIGVRSLLGIPLRTGDVTHGCVIIQQCNSRHAWTRGEIDMVQNVADTIAEALSKLPEQKLEHEPIMRLHQRELMEAGGDKSESILAVRRALRGALGAQTISAAQKTSAPKASSSAPMVSAPSTAKAAPATPTQTAPAPAEVQPAAAQSTPAAPAMEPAQQAAPEPPRSTSADAIAGLAEMIMQQADTPAQAEVQTEPHKVAASLDNLLGALRGQTSEILRPQFDLDAPQAVTDAASQAPPPQPPIFDPSAQSPAQQAPAAHEPSQTGSSNPPPGGSFAAQLDAIPTPSAKKADTPWGDLDSIPTPAAGPSRGLGASMMGRKSSGSSSPLLASLHRDKSKFAPPPVEHVEGPPVEIDEAQAQEKLKQILSDSNPLSDYVFATKGIDARMLGRIDGWLTQVEQKDKYLNGHAMAVAEYSIATGRVLGMSEDELQQLRLAALLHDVGKLGLPGAILQRNADDLEDTELLMLMKHPIDGSVLLEGFPELASLAPVVLAHHEEFNGNGYPAGLKGEEIPLHARIINVASTYHGMVTQTRTNNPVAPEEAQQAIRMGSGESYDPRVVEAFLAALQQGAIPAVV